MSPVSWCAVAWNFLVGMFIKFSLERSTFLVSTSACKSVFSISRVILGNIYNVWWKGSNTFYILSLSCCIFSSHSNRFVFNVCVALPIKVFRKRFRQQWREILISISKRRSYRFARHSTPIEKCCRCREDTARKIVPKVVGLISERFQTSFPVFPFVPFL